MGLRARWCGLVRQAPLSCVCTFQCKMHHLHGCRAWARKSAGDDVGALTAQSAKIVGKNGY